MSTDSFFGGLFPRWSRFLFPTYYLGFLLGGIVAAIFWCIGCFFGAFAAIGEGVVEGFKNIMGDTP